MGSLPNEVKSPWIRTPCIHSPELSRIAGCNIYLKLDNLQPSGSFKSRGIGNLMTLATQEKHSSSPSSSSRDDTDSSVHFYCSSGGNAGLACATAAAALHRPATIVLPLTAPPLMKRKLLALGASVQVHGNVWAEADGYLRGELLANDPAGVYVPPFDHQHVWDGASTIVGELREQMPRGEGIHAILCAVGGGGLLNGLMQGVESADWRGNGGSGGDEGKPLIIAVETEGADSLHASVKAGEHVTLPGITSIAKSLGATRVSERTWRWSQERPDVLKSMVVSDADAAMSCVRFADDARMLVEVSCGAAIAPVYRGDLRRMIGEGLSDEEWAGRNVVVEVCGGAGVALETLATYREEYGGLTSIKSVQV